MSQENSASPTDFFRHHGYVLIREFLPIEVCYIAARYTVMKSRVEFCPEPEAGQVPGTHSCYADTLTESLLDCVTPRIESITGLRLFPSYSFYRVYTPGDVLHRHRDRAACEISVSVCLGYGYRTPDMAYRWPIHVESLDGSNSAGQRLACNPGDALIYRGCEVDHWRDEFDAPEGSWHAQAFLHFVRQDGPYADACRFDGRPGLGLPADTKDPEKMEEARRLHSR